MRKRMVLGVLMCLLLLACAASQQNVQQATPLQTAEKVALGFIQILNDQETQTASLSNQPNLTDAQKQIVRQKKALLVQIWPKVKAFYALIEAGTVPTADVQTEITNLLNQLVAITGGS